MAAGSFETIITQGKQVLAESTTEPPADVALYALGEVYAHQEYGGRDYALSQYYFKQLVDNFPHSTLASEAKIYLSLFEAIAAKTKEAVDVAQKPQEEKIAPPKEKKSLPVAAPRKIIENQDFEQAAQRNLQILEEAGKKKPADEALYNLGLIYAHADNPAKDYRKSQTYFHSLTEQFPDSYLAEEAQIWLGLFETLEKIQQIDIEIEQQKKQLTN